MSDVNPSRENLQSRILLDFIEDISPMEPIFVLPDTMAIDVVTKMQDRQIGSALVVDRENNLLGIFTDRDVLLKVGLDELDIHTTEISKLMTPDPVCVNHDDPIAAALNKMAVGEFRHIPVLQDNKPVSIISIREVFHHLCSE